MAYRGGRVNYFTATALKGLTIAIFATMTDATATQRNQQMSIAPEAKLAMGRIFGMMMREEQPGDIAEYERCRAIIMNASDTIIIDHSPNFARDYGKGAQGQWN